MYLWRQWKNGHNRFKELRRRGVSKFQAAVAAGSPTGFWRMSRTSGGPKGTAQPRLQRSRSAPPLCCPLKLNPVEPPRYATRMPGGVGGAAPQGVPLSRSFGTSLPSWGYRDFVRIWWITGPRWTRPRGLVVTAYLLTSGRELVAPAACQLLPAVIIRRVCLRCAYPGDMSRRAVSLGRLACGVERRAVEHKAATDNLAVPDRHALRGRRALDQFGLGVVDH